MATPTRSMAEPTAEALAPKRLRTLTATALRSARACPKLFQYRYVLGYEPVERAETLLFGSLIHKALEAWWKSSANLDYAIAAIDLSSPPPDPFAAALARALMTGYHHRWVGEWVEPLAIEAHFSTDLINPDTGAASRTFNLEGRVDGIVPGDTGTKLIEHKTASEDISFGSDYWKRLRLDSQISIYYRGAEALGHSVTGCIYDVLGKPGLRPYKATPVESRKFTKGKPCKVEHGSECPVCAVAGERDTRPCHAEMGCIMCDGTGWKEIPRLQANQREADETAAEFEARIMEEIASNPNRYYQRGEVVRLEAEMVEANQDAWQTAQVVRDNLALGRWPKNPDACVRYGRTCEYFGCCTGEASLDDPGKFRKLDNVHPELG